MRLSKYPWTHNKLCYFLCLIVYLHVLRALNQSSANNLTCFATIRGIHLNFFSAEWGYSLPIEYYDSIKGLLSDSYIIVDKLFIHIVQGGEMVIVSVKHI